MLHSVDVEELDRRTVRWMAEQQRIRAGAGLALDGKTVRGSGAGEQSALHLLSAIVHGSGTVVAQAAVETKTNEIARHIVEDKRADDVFTVKGNQPTTREAIAELFASDREDAERQQRARNPSAPADAFPPSAPQRRQGPRAAGDA